MTEQDAIMVYRYLDTRRKLRAAVRKVRRDVRAGVDIGESFATFMDTVVPDWRKRPEE